MSEDPYVDPAALLEAVPFCRYLGITVAKSGDGLLLTMPFAPHLVGNPMLPALHGGVTGSLLETAAVMQVAYETGGKNLPTPVDITVDYLRSARAATSYARARIARQGRRVVNVQAEM
jgi:uncharacterized protein (TIGR00369 family)